MRKVRSDASVKTVKEKIEEEYGLPKDSIAILNTNKKAARSDKKIESLRNEYDKEE